MSRLTILIAFLLALTTSSFAKPTDITNEIKVSFSRNFKNAQVMNTEVHNTFTKLTFKLNDMVMFAFYSENGQLLAVTRNIQSTQLPMNLLISLKNNYSSYWIPELFEFSGEGQNCYYITLENADSKIVLRSSGDNWEVYSTVQK